ncbi:hypothetical protein GGR32_000160 [Mesonia hippocampi]|uniref:Uncharacterized protein n=1 Tax=Mesonia hippocampi TaxID=1628250 RepID=A0A840EI97_9FLAO|nr:hypothetical protein [Mesonia hippocampi]MBB4117888.1 hypothetical protein [Mesonia hippocampi]
MKAVSSQRKQLYKLFRYSKETEALHVRHITGCDDKTEAKELTASQAKQLIASLTTHWAYFDKNNQQHSYILSLLRQIGWTKSSERYGIIADMDRLSDFLKSKKSPVPKPLQNMDSTELSTLINCLESILGKKYGAK